MEGPLGGFLTPRCWHRVFVGPMELFAYSLCSVPGGTSDFVDVTPAADHVFFTFYTVALNIYLVQVSTIVQIGRLDVC